MPEPTPNAGAPPNLFGLAATSPQSDDSQGLLSGSFWHGDDWRGSVSWLYHELLPTTGVCLLTAPSGAGKTFVALHLAQSLATGARFFGVEPEERGGSVILVGEAFGSVKMRLAGLGEPGSQLPVVARYVGGLAARAAWADLKARLRAVADEMRACRGVPARLVILDTLSSSGILLDENDNASVATVMKALADLSIELGVLIVVIHHPPKSGVGERGAGAIKNNADYALTITRQGQRPVREIEVTKSRDGECRVLGSFTLVPVVIGIDAKGRPVTTMTVSTGEPLVREAKRPSRHAAIVEDCFAIVHAVAPLTVRGRIMVERDRVRAEFNTRQPVGRDKSNVSRDFRAGLATGEIEEIIVEGKSFLARRPVGGQPLSYRSPPKVGDLTDNPNGQSG